MVDRDAREAMDARGLQNAPMFSVPMPFNTLLWRVVVMTPDGYLEGYRSLAVDRKPMTFTAWPSNTPALRELAAMPDVARLLWFTSGFMGAREVKGQLVLSDLRMGAEPDYTFQYGVAQRLPGGAWQATEPQKVGGFRNAREQLGRAWGRLWAEP